MSIDIGLIVFFENFNFEFNFQNTKKNKISKVKKKVIFLFGKSFLKFFVQNIISGKKFTF